jgi:hypothetical protein
MQEIYQSMDINRLVLKFLSRAEGKTILYALIGRKITCEFA